MKKRMLKSLSVWLTILAGVICQLYSQTADSRLVLAEWLQTNLSRKDLRIIDMRADIRDYWAGHIPGAVYLDETALRWPSGGVPGRLLPLEVFVRLLEEMGIDHKTTIIIYTEVNNYRATYLAWALDYFGHSNWAILDGGFNRWKSENRPVSRDYPAIERKGYGRRVVPDETVRVTLDQVKNRNPEKTVLLDVRPAELYSGERGNWKRNGHIPGAINIFWASFLKEDGSWKDLKFLAENLRALGITPDKTIIVSCGQGLMASHTYLTLKYLLKYPDVRLYDGSFNEWSNRDELPVETGRREER
ncbi:MAG: sulfurtransferase [Candidatus Saccharicenans sp.]